MAKSDVRNLLQAFVSLKNKNSHLVKCNINILDELHANENAHTRLLLRLFELNDGDGHVVLNSFIDDCINHGKNTIPHMQNPRVYVQYENMDGFVVDPCNSIIVIENKINGAIDQRRQIERYVKNALAYAKKHKISNDRIYVVYLTDNGEKKVSNYSFTRKTKEMLGWKSETDNGRFIELNYRYNILPLLEDLLEEYDFFKKTLLAESYLLQYVDYLQGRYYERKVEKEYYEKMDSGLRKILEDFGILKNVSGAEAVERIEELKSEVSQYLDDIKHEIYPNDPIFLTSEIRNRIKKARNENEGFSHCDKFGIWQRSTIYTRDLKTKLDRGLYFGIDIYIQENEYQIMPHPIKITGEWSGVNLKNNLGKHPGLRAYLNEKYKFCENNYYFLKGKFKSVDDLYEKIKNEFDRLYNTI